jgi:hypothetical protein
VPHSIAPYLEKEQLRKVEALGIETLEQLQADCSGLRNVPFCRRLCEVHGILPVPVKRRRALVATNPIEE